MNTQTNFFKTHRQKFIISDKDLRMNSALEPQRVRTSSSPKRIHLIKEYGMKKNQVPIMPNIVSNYNIQNLTALDTDKLQEELIKAKNEVNKKNKEYAALKIAFSKLDSENKRNIKIIEEVLDLAAKQKVNNERRPEEYESEVKNILADTNLSANNVFKLKEAHIVNSLKRQVHDFKVLLATKEDELNLLKNNAKVSKFHEVEIKLKNTIEELNELNENYNILKQSFLEKENKLKEVIEERDYYKAMMLRIKSQWDETKERMQYLQDQNVKLSEINKNLEDKNSSNKYKTNSIQSQLREKDNTISTLRDEIKSYEEFKYEKEKMEKTIGDLNRSLKNLKEDFEKKNRKVKDVEKANSDLKERVDLLLADNKKTQTVTVGPLQISQREKDKKIRKLEEDNISAKKEIKKLAEELKNLRDEIRKKEELALEEQRANMEGEENMGNGEEEPQEKGQDNNHDEGKNQEEKADQIHHHTENEDKNKQEEVEKEIKKENHLQIDIDSENINKNSTTVNKNNTSTPKNIEEKSQSPKNDEKSVPTPKEKIPPIRDDKEDQIQLLSNRENQIQKTIENEDKNETENNPKIETPEEKNIPLQEEQEEKNENDIHKLITDEKDSGYIDFKDFKENAEEDFKQEENLQTEENPNQTHQSKE